MTALAWAAYGGCKQVVDTLLKARSNPDIQDHVCYFCVDHVIATVDHYSVLV
jgi:hypothetical protein